MIREKNYEEYQSGWLNDNNASCSRDVTIDGSDSSDGESEESVVIATVIMRLDHVKAREQ